MFRNLLARMSKYLGLLPALDGVFAETLAQWFDWNLPEKLEFVRGRGTIPHLLALGFCALSFFIFQQVYRPLSVSRVAIWRSRFGICALVLLLLSANFILIDVSEEWLSPSATSWRIGLTYWAYVLGYISLGGTIAEKK
jgi:hypothetical protein